MKPIIYIKEGLLGNLATIAFMLGLATLVIWLGKHSQYEATIPTRIVAGIFVLCCYFPLDNIRHPKARTLLIEGDEIVWRIRGQEGGDKVVQEERLPL